MQLIPCLRTGHAPSSCSRRDSNAGPLRDLLLLRPAPKLCLPRMLGVPPMAFCSPSPDAFLSAERHLGVSAVVKVPAALHQWLSKFT